MSLRVQHLTSPSLLDLQTRSDSPGLADFTRCPFDHCNSPRVCINEPHVLDALRRCSSNNNNNNKEKKTGETEPEGFFFFFSSFVLRIGPYLSCVLTLTDFSLLTFSRMPAKKRRRRRIPRNNGFIWRPKNNQFSAASNSSHAVKTS